MPSRGSGAMRSRRGREAGLQSAAAVAARKSATQAMVAAAPDLIREYISHPERVELYCAQLIADIRDPESSGHRTAMRTYPELLGMVGAESLVVNALVLQLGAPIADARAAVEAVGSAPRDPHEIAAQARAYLAWFDGPDGPGGQAE